jgi:uncharacterized protein
MLRGTGISTVLPLVLTPIEFRLNLTKIYIEITDSRSLEQVCETIPVHIFNGNCQPPIAEGDAEMDKTLEQMSQLVNLIAQALVDEPREVMVRGLEGNNTMVLELHVAKEDVGKVIGRQGRTADALRTLVRAVSAKLKKRTVLEIIDEQREAAFELRN